MTVLNMASSLPVVLEPAGHIQTDLEAVFDRCSRSLYRYFIVRTGEDSHLADDLMQQLWLQATMHERKHPSRIPATDMEYWLRGIAKNLIRAHWRTHSQRPDTIPITDPALAAELSDRLISEELPVEVLERKEVRDQLLLALTTLSHDEQELIIGYYFRDESHSDLSRMLGISTRAVEGRLYRARQSIRAALSVLEK